MVSSSNHDEPIAQSLTVLTWDSHGMIHLMDAVRGAFWALRSRSRERPAGHLTVELVAIGWARKRARYAVSRERVTLVLDPTSPPRVAIGNREISRRMVLTSRLPAAIHSLSVLFGTKVVRESHDHRYRERPVLTFGDVQVGDLIASEYFAGQRSHRGEGLSARERVRDRLRLARVTYYAYLTYAKAMQAAREFRGTEVVVFATEWTYTHEILSRIFERHNGSSCIYRDEFGYFFALSELTAIPETDFFARQASVMPRGGRNSMSPDGSTIESEASVSAAFCPDRRFHLAVADEQGPESREGQQTVPIVVYLHDVRDAQYVCGVDGYRDIQHWAYETLEILSTRSGVLLLAKPHPNILGESRTGPNNDFLAILGREFPGVFWIPPHVALDDLLNEFGPTLVVISHHGTVGLEMAQRGLRALVSGLAPYGNYCIARYWYSRESYKTTLLSSPLEYLVGRVPATEVLGETELFDRNRVNEVAFVPTYRLLASLAGTVFPEGVYADTWLEMWQKTSIAASAIGMKDCVEFCLTKDFGAAESKPWG